VTELAVSRGLLDQPGTVAFLVIFGMAVILFFVFRSMAKHLRKIQMAARADEEAAAKANGTTPGAEGDAVAREGDAGFETGFDTGTDTGAVTGTDAGPGGRSA
jgi:hypothetical protein